jgi:hypothetical protein
MARKGAVMGNGTKDGNHFKGKRKKQSRRYD